MGKTDYDKTIQCKCGYYKMDHLVSHNCGTEYWCHVCGAVCSDAFENGDYKWQIPELADYAEWPLSDKE